MLQTKREGTNIMGIARDDGKQGRVNRLSSIAADSMKVEEW